MGASSGTEIPADVEVVNIASAGESITLYARWSYIYSGDVRNRFKTFLQEHSEELNMNYSGNPYNCDGTGNCNVPLLIQDSVAYVGTNEEREEQDLATLGAIANALLGTSKADLDSITGGSKYGSWNDFIVYGFDSGGGIGRNWYKDSWPGEYIYIYNAGFTPMNTSGKLYSNEPLFFADSTFAGSEYALRLKIDSVDSNNNITALSLILRNKSSNTNVYSQSYSL